MAIIFELWAECSTPESTRDLATHFAGLSHTLLSGRTVAWTVTVADGSGDQALTVWSRDLSARGVRTVNDAIETTECGLRLYHHLKQGPAFRFARVAWEAELIPMVELKDYLGFQSDGRPILSLECAMDAELYTALGSPLFFTPFREGHLWHRYTGETYKPFFGGDQDDLNNIGRELFPEYFSY